MMKELFPIDCDQKACLLNTELETLFRVSQVLSRSLNLHETLQGVLVALHESAGMQRGMVTLKGRSSDSQSVVALYDVDPQIVSKVSYQPGEGIVGAIFKSGRRRVSECLGGETDFLDRLGFYDPGLPFIGVPIQIGSHGTVGVLAAQPISTNHSELDLRARFLEMVANLIAQSVQLSWQVETEKRAIADERDNLRREVRANYGFDNMVGRSPLMRRVFDQVRQVAKWNTTVLIRGESGTGKELIANAIHYNSPRASNTFVKLNCAALPDNLLESELFGHEKGAFTGASSQRKGRFEQASGGTIFLDEIGEISPAFQAKLLRVLQEGEFERIGSNTTIKVDVRIIAATNRDLESEVEEGEFREDLYYRLNVMPIQMPPLRERIEDIPELAGYLIEKISKQQGRDLSITDSAVRVLMRHSWPGNVRELENSLERAAIMSSDGTIDREAVTLSGIEERMVQMPSASGHSSNVDLDAPDLDERERVIAALEQAGWVQAKAARLLNMTPRQIAYRVQTLRIKMRQI
jgi:Nif-specific regulatory protein